MIHTLHSFRYAVNFSAKIYREPYLCISKALCPEPFHAIPLGAMVIFIAGMTAGMNTTKVFAIIGMIGFAVAIGCVVVMMFWVRCPSCGGNPGYALSWPATWDLSVSKRIRFCQFCGLDLDKEIDPRRFEPPRQPDGR